MAKDMPSNGNRHFWQLSEVDKNDMSICKCILKCTSWPNICPSHGNKHPSYLREVNKMRSDLGHSFQVLLVQEWIEMESGFPGNCKVLKHETFFSYSLGVPQTLKGGGVHDEWVCA